MNARNLTAISTSIVCFLLVVASAGEKSSPEPIRIGSRLELFADGYVVDSMQGVNLQLHSPASVGKIFSFDKPWEGNVSWNLTTIKDGERYRMYYLGRSAPDYVRQSGLKAGETVVPQHPHFLCLAESRDGITWTKPSLGIFEFQGSKDNNIVSSAEQGPGVPFLDANPAATPAERYKAAWAKKGTDGVWGMNISASADGLRWKKWREQPVFTSALPNAFDSVNLIFWSESESQYVCYFRFADHGVRSIVRTTSKNLMDWSEQVPLDFGDTPLEHFYTNGVTPYFRAPHIYFGFPKRFSPWRKKFDDMPNAGISEAVLMSSRDGLHWTRFMEAFIPPGRDPRNWVHRTTHVSSGLVQTAEDRISLYASRNYTYPSAHMERFEIRADGFVSVHAGYPGGECVTKPFVYQGGNLIMNYATSATGSIQIEMQNAAGRPIPGFTLEESPVIFGDEIAEVVRWNRPIGQTDREPLKRLAGAPVRLRFVMREADVFSFQFK